MARSVEGRTEMGKAGPPVPRKMPWKRFREGHDFSRAVTDSFASALGLRSCLLECRFGTAEDSPGWTVVGSPGFTVDMDVRPLCRTLARSHSGAPEEIHLFCGSDLRSPRGPGAARTGTVPRLTQHPASPPTANIRGRRARSTLGYSYAVPTALSFARGWNILGGGARTLSIIPVCDSRRG